MLIVTAPEVVAGEGEEGLELLYPLPPPQLAHTPARAASARNFVLNDIVTFLD